MVFAVAGRLKMDVREVHQWPIIILKHWVAFFRLQSDKDLIKKVEALEEGDEDEDG